MLQKEAHIEFIKKMPAEKFENIDTVLEEIILMDKIENSLLTEKKDHVLTEEEVNKEIKKW